MGTAANYAIIATAPINHINLDGTAGTYEVGTIVNVVVWDGEASYTPPANTRIEPLPPGAMIGQSASS